MNDDKHTSEERAAAERIGTTPEDLDLAFAATQAAGATAEKAGIDDLVVAYATARANREAVSDEEKRLRDIEAKAELALFDRMEALNLRSVRHEKLGLFTLNDMANAVVTDAAALREWALEVMPELLSPNRQTLGKIVRDLLKEGGDLPPGIEPAFYRKINWRRAP